MSLLSSSSSSSTTEKTVVSNESSKSEICAGKDLSQSPSSVTDKYFDIIVAATRTGGIGYKGQLPWPGLPGDMKFFKEKTSNTTDSKKRNMVIMGRKTWRSIPSRFRPLKGRLNVILANPTNAREEELDKDLGTGTEGDNRTSIVFVHTFQEALNIAEKESDNVENVFVIGGERLYREALHHPKCKSVYLTQILHEKVSDVFFDMDFLKRKFLMIHEGVVVSDDPWSYQFLKYASNNNIVSALSAVMTTSETYVVTNSNPALIFSNSSKKRKSDSSSDGPTPSTLSLITPREHKSPEINFVPSKHEEYQYLDLVKNIITKGVSRGDRTGTGTRSVFGAQMRFSLRNGVIPVLTTKRIPFKTVVKEALWFISGKTDSNILHDQGVFIWDANGSREFLDRVGLKNNKQGDLGPVYGHQWRHYGAEYVNCETSYKGKGIDQLQELIQMIKKDPNSRRLVLTSWNSTDIPKMALPPCHCLCQFYVADGRLSCQLYQRSGDMGLGIPFNIASYALITCMIAHICGLEPDEFVHTIGDTHVYNNHVEPLSEQCKRIPRPFPKLSIKTKRTNIDEFIASDFELLEYDPMESIPMAMSA